MDKLFRSVPMKVATTEKANNLTFVISTRTPDRDEDILEPKGCQLKNYKKNSVVLFAHDYHSLPIGKSVNIMALDDHISAEVEFAPTQFAQEVRVLCEQGFLNAASVGFIPIEAEPIESKDDGSSFRRGQRFKKWDLLEWSIVPVPSNFEALIQNAKSKGIEVEAMEKELIKDDPSTGEVIEEPLPEVEITSFDDPNRVLLDPSTGETRTEPFEVDTLTIEDSDSFKEIHISSAMAEKLVIDGSKSGRVLSASNEKKIRAASEALSEVLKQLGEQDDDDDDKATFITLDEAIERLEIVAGMMTAEKETPYIEFDIDKEDDEMLIDLDELADVIRSSIKPELSKLRLDMTGKIE